MFISDVRLCHRDWRKLVKKLRRKRDRQLRAQSEEKKNEIEISIRLLDPEYRRILKANEDLEAEALRIEEEKAIRQKREWIARDKALHQKWLHDRKLKEILLLEKQKQEAIIRKEWQDKQEQELKKKKEENQKNQLLQSATDALSNNNTRLPSPPPGYVRQEDRPKREDCPFFMKTGACRFGIHCSREHIYPEVSRSILLPNMYNYLGLENHLSDNYDTDLSLEFTETEIYQHYRDFYNDILPEFEKCGRVTQLKVCCNKSAHLRGNVYVQYKEELEAMKAFALFNGRYYAGRQITCVYVQIEKWKPAICGLFWQKRCPKGGSCNFLHVFKNPGNAYNNVDYSMNEASHNTDIRYNHTRQGSSSHRSRYAGSSRSPSVHKSSRHTQSDSFNNDNYDRNKGEFKSSKRSKDKNRSSRSASTSKETRDSSSRSRSKIRKRRYSSSRSRSKSRERKYSSKNRKDGSSRSRKIDSYRSRRDNSD